MLYGRHGGSLGDTHRRVRPYGNENLGVTLMEVVLWPYHNTNAKAEESS